MDDFRIVGTGETPLFVIKLVPSISPIFRNNPAFQVYRFEGSTSAITSYQTYYLANLTTAERPTKLEDLQWLPEYDFVRRIAKRGWTSLPCVNCPRLADEYLYPGFLYAPLLGECSAGVG
jgi:hypothetical protein